MVTFLQASAQVSLSSVSSWVCVQPPWLIYCACCDQQGSGTAGVGKLGQSMGDLATSLERSPSGLVLICFQMRKYSPEVLKLRG